MKIFSREFSPEAFWLIIIGVFIWLANLGIFTFRRDWPLILIVIGVMELLNSLLGKRKRLLKLGSNTNHKQERFREEISEVLSDLSSGKISSEEAYDKIKDIKDKYQE